MNKIEELTEDDLLEIWPVIGGAPHLFDYGKDELKEILITGNVPPECSLTLDFYTMAAIVDVLRSRGYTTPEYVNAIKIK